MPRNSNETFVMLKGVETIKLKTLYLITEKYKVENFFIEDNLIYFKFNKGLILIKKYKVN